MKPKTRIARSALASDGVIPPSSFCLHLLLPLFTMLINFELVSFNALINNILIPVGQLGGNFYPQELSNDSLPLVQRPMKRDVIKLLFSADVLTGCSPSSHPCWMSDGENRKRTRFKGGVHPIIKTFLCILNCANLKMNNIT